MKPLSDAELRMNQQAAMVAASVLSEPVEAATRCEQVTNDMQLGAAGFGGFTRGMSRANRAIGRAMPGTMGQMSRQMETAGLPNSFILAVTSSQIHALEDKRQGDDLVAGRVLKSWARAGFVARRSSDRMNAYRGVPDDRQVLIIFLPIEGGRSRILQAAARNAAAAGSAGFPHKVMVGKDAPSQRVMDVLGATGGAGPNIVIGGQSLQDMIAQAASAQAQAASAQAPASAQAQAAPGAAQAAPGAAGPQPAYPPPQPSVAERLQQLETLRATGVITDAEYTRKREQIISEL